VTAARSKALYAYAIVGRESRRPPSLGKGAGGGDLVVLALRGTRAGIVVERTPPPLAPSRASVVAHDRVVRRLGRTFSAILPLRFATTAPDEASLRALLAPLSGAIGRALDRVRGAVQFDLRVTGRRARRTPPAAAAGPGTRWLATKTARLRVPELAPLTEATHAIVRATRLERHDAGPWRKAPVDAPFASAYHLVARADVRAWRRAVASAVPLLAQRKVGVVVTGPFPPYAFAELG
jgi:hypothetical protein